MKDRSESDAEYLVRRHELHVARQFMPDLAHALIATNDAGLGRSIQALLRVVFGYQPDIKTVNTMGGVLDGLAEGSPDLMIIDDRLGADQGLDLVSLLGGKRCLTEVIVISKKYAAADILVMKEAGVADIIHPGRLDAARLTEAYIRACIFSELEERIRDGEFLGSEPDEADVIALEPRSAMTHIAKKKSVLRA